MGKVRGEGQGEKGGKEGSAKRQAPRPCQTKALSPRSVLKVPKRGQFHAAIRVTPKRCDSCVHWQVTLGKRTVSRRNLCNAEWLAKRCDKTSY